MGHYLNLVDQERWADFVGRRTDAGNRDGTWGFTKRSTVTKGDFLICLLMRRHVWCGVMEVAGDPLPPDDPRVAADADFPVRFPVKTVVALPVEQGIDVFDPGIWPFLSRTKGIEPRAPHWNVRAGLRVDLARFAPEDGAFLMGALLASRQWMEKAGGGDVEIFDPADATVEGGPISGHLHAVRRRLQPPTVQRPDW